MLDAPKLLKEWRKATGTSQAACAKLVGVSQPSLNMWETGLRMPQIEHAFRLQEVTHGAVPAEAWRTNTSTGTDG